jgi:hypothetical protein
MPAAGLPPRYQLLLTIGRKSGSRAKSFHTCQGLRPRRVGRTLAIPCPSVLPSVISNTSALGTIKLTRLNGWPCVLPCRRFADTLADAHARLGADVDRYSFTVVDLHRLLLAGFDRRTKNLNFRNRLLRLQLSCQSNQIRSLCNVTLSGDCFESRTMISRPCRYALSAL